jgi:hypothetical protein
MRMARNQGGIVGGIECENRVSQIAGNFWDLELRQQACAIHGFSGAFTPERVLGGLKAKRAISQQL